MYLLPSARGHGLGKYLLKQLEATITTQGFQEIWIEIALIIGGIFAFLLIDRFPNWLNSKFGWNLILELKLKVFLFFLGGGGFAFAVACWLIYKK